LRTGLEIFPPVQLKLGQSQMLAIPDSQVVRTRKQWYQTAGFKENAILHGVLDRSYRKTAVAFNTQRLDRWLAPTGRDLPPAVLSMHRQRLAAQWNTMLHRQIQTLALTCSSSA